jgi:hypothetical protein
LGDLTAMVLMVIATLIALSITWGSYVLCLKRLTPIMRLDRW